MDPTGYWMERAASKTFATPFDLEMFKRHVDPGARILDYGCGYGRIMGDLVNNGFDNVSGVDISQALLERGRKQFPSLDFWHFEGGRIPFKNNSFDVVLLLGVLTCIPGDHEQRVTLREITRVLRPGGMVYMNDFLLNKDRRNLDRYAQGAHGFDAYGVFITEDGAICRHHDSDHFPKLLEGWEVLENEELTFETMNGNISRGVTLMAVQKD